MSGTALDSLAAELLAAGRLIGLLTGSGTEPASVDLTWFEDPKKKLQGIPHRLDELTTVLAAVLGDPEPDPPRIPGGSGQWYHLPNLDLGVPTAAHVIAPAAGETSGALGVGLYAATRLGPATIEAHVYVPLADLAGRFLLAGRDAQTVHVGLSAKSAGRFAITGGASFSALEIDAQIHLGDDPPSCTVTFVDLQDAGDKAATYTNLKDLLDPTVLEWLGAVIVQGTTPWLLQYPGDAPGRVPPPPDAPDQTLWPMTIGDILVAAHFLTKHEPTSPNDTTPPYQLDLHNLQGTGKQIAENLAFAVLDALAAGDEPLIALPGGGLYVEHRTDSDQYGLRVAAQIEFGQQFDLCVGQWMSGEADRANWMTKASGTPADAGLSIMLLSHRGGEGPSFDPEFSLTSVGLNLRGAGGAPLVNVGGYTLGEAEVRASLSSSDWQWGVAARLDDVGFPLGPGFAEAQRSEGNVVARTLVAGDDTSAAKGADGQPAAVNPAFSIEAGYVSGHDNFVFELLDASGARADMVWIPVQRRFGPLTCNKVGIEIEVSGPHLHDPVVGVGLDGGVTLGPLDIELDQLTVGVHLKAPGDPSSYELDLQGLAISYVTESVALSGGLIKVTHPDKRVSYDGEALLKAKNLALSAVGSFGSLPDGSTSLFVFTWIDAPIGGPPFFYVTGLAAGFGYNRALRIPTQDQVQGFPLVAGVSNPKLLGATPPHDPKAPVPKPSPATVLGALESWVPPERGEYWLAAGVQFTTFEIVHTNALLVVEFGNELVVALLGIATLKQPLVGKPWVYAELDVEVVFRPREGTLTAAAVLAPSSYVLTADAHLTGGFAFASWFGAEHNGEFVLTLGGYHPAFQVPSYYPQEPRVGVDWKVSSEIVVVGGVYFAMTPAAMMAGGELQVTFEAGPLKAWLKAEVGVILFWHPFFVDANVSISIGVSFHIQVLSVDTTLSLEIGVDFELWGPPIGFRAHVDWYIVSFTIGKGDKHPPAPIGWEDFKKLLPVETQAAPAPRHAARQARAMAAPAPAAPAAPTATTPAYVTISAVGGLLRSTIVEGATHWLARARGFAFAADCTFPPTTIDVPAEGHDDQHVKQTAAIAIRPVGMAAGKYSAPQTIRVVRLVGPHPAPTAPGDLAAVDWAVTHDVRGVPQALWGAPVKGTSPPPNPDGPTVPAIVGATVAPKQALPATCTPEMRIDVVFVDRVVNADTEKLPIAPGDQPVGTPPVSAHSFAHIAQTASDDVRSKRSALFGALGGLGVNAWYDEPLTAMAASPGDSFADEPLEGAPA